MKCAIQLSTANRDSAETTVVNSFLILGKGLDQVAGAPSRCGYDVGLLAVRAWQRTHPDNGPADLIATSPADIWKSFPLETDQ